MLTTGSIHINIGLDAGEGQIGGIQSRVRTAKDVLYSDVVCEGVGCGLSQTG
jgi:hypothetical protein